MSDELNNQNALIRNPTQYLTKKGQGLQDRLDAIKLDEGAEEKIARDRLKKTVRDRFLGLFRIGDVIKEILDFNSGVDAEIKEAKKQVLLAAYFDKCEENSDAVAKLKGLLMSAEGNTLFTKILRILDENPPDLELINCLSGALAYIAGSDFEALFEDHKYALGQIDQLTPQALIILSDSASWPQMRLSSYNSQGSKIISDFVDAFSEAYCQAKKIQSSSLRDKVKHSLADLRTKNLLEARLVNNGENLARASLTDIGATIARYLGA